MDENLIKFCDELTPIMNQMDFYKGNNKLIIWIKPYFTDVFLNLVDNYLDTDFECYLKFVYWTGNDMVVKELEEVLDNNFDIEPKDFIDLMIKRGITPNYWEHNLKEE